MRLDGIHHLSATTGDAVANLAFYRGVLGLCLTKKTVSEDDPNAYHLLFGDDAGTPGSTLTFFEYSQARRGTAGAGMVGEYGRARRPFDQARAQLDYGRLLPRQRRRVDARDHLREAFETFQALDATPWTERAQAELRATGETARRRDPAEAGKLTAQELQVARFVARGLSNREVAAQLFLSPRTVDFHLRNVFVKLGISSRVELANLELDVSPTGRPAAASSAAH